MEQREVRIRKRNGRRSEGNNSGRICEEGNKKGRESEEKFMILGGEKIVREGERKEYGRGSE
jgi:hypothetical protein